MEGTVFRRPFWWLPYLLGFCLLLLLLIPGYLYWKRGQRQMEQLERLPTRRQLRYRRKAIPLKEDELAILECLYTAAAPVDTHTLYDSLRQGRETEEALRKRCGQAIKNLNEKVALYTDQPTPLIGECPSPEDKRLKLFFLEI